MILKEEEIKEANIYYVKYGGGDTELVFRFKETKHIGIGYFTALHYWKGYEKYHKKDEFTMVGVEELREATQAEQHALFRNEIEKGF